jgi:hypothetical protein
MSLSIYQASIPVFTHVLGNLSAILGKAATHAQAVGIAPADLLDARLAPDMFDLKLQVQAASDSARGCAARLADKEMPAYAYSETSFAELQARLERTIDFLDGLDAKLFEGAESRTVMVKLPQGGELKFIGQDYLFKFALPNFFFHVTTAYALLRHKGVEIGKADYLGNIA